MSPIPNLKYPKNELALLNRQAALFNDWIASMISNPADFEDYTVNDFVFDGFYPAYLEQKVRVLFIGRESRGLSGCNYIEVLHNCYRHGKRVGEVTLNQHKFHRLMLYLAYSLNNEFCDWESIPYADKIGDTIGEKGGLSFAFMNLSKFSNERAAWQVIPELVNCSVSASRGDRNFIREQIELLSPHVIISMNLQEHLGLIGERKEIERHEYADAYRLKAGNHSALLIDTFHFAATGKGDRQHYIDPIRELASKHLEI